MSTVNQRIAKIITELYSGNKRAFSTKIGVSAAVIENIVGKRQSSPSFYITNKILLSIDNINAEWLITGNGNMLKLHNKVQLINNNLNFDFIKKRAFPKYLENKKIQSIPLYTILPSNEINSLFSNKAYLIPSDFINIPNAPTCDGALAIRGESMYPVLKSGDIVCYKIIKDVEDIQYGEMYILYIEDNSDKYLTAKYVSKSEKGGKYLKLTTNEKNKTEKDQLKSQIKYLALIKMYIRINTIS